MGLRPVKMDVKRGAKTIVRKIVRQGISNTVIPAASAVFFNFPIYF